MIGNITRLKTLDLSNNLLHDLTSDEEIFRLPANITEIYLSGNQINSLPWSGLRKTSMLSTLDLSRNNFDYFDQTLVSMVKKGVNVYFEGTLVY